MLGENKKHRKEFVMNKLVKRVVTGVITVATVVSMTSITAFAATPSYVNSVGSSTKDISVVDNSGYSVVGNDTTQNKKSTYTNISLADESVTSPCEVYATVAEGAKGYDPDNPQANEDGFVDGAVVVSLPTTLIISGTPNSKGEYIGTGLVKAKGNVAGTTVINVVPDATVTLSSVGKSNITANITTEYTQFALPTSTATGDKLNKHLDYVFNDDCKSVITVKANNVSAGSWNGAFNNNVSLSTVK